MTTITTSYGGTAGPQIVFNYDKGSRLTSTSRQIGSSSTATEVNTTIVYDNANRVTTITDGVSTYNSFPPAGARRRSRPTSYSYDNANRVTTQVNADGTYTYTYDNANELTSVYKSGTQSESYSYDLNGNRTGTGYSTTVMNETATSPGPVTYTYDAAGNMITSKSGSTTTTYTYDAGYAYCSPCRMCYRSADSATRLKQRTDLMILLGRATCSSQTLFAGSRFAVRCLAA